MMNNPLRLNSDNQEMPAFSESQTFKNETNLLSFLHVPHLKLRLCQPTQSVTSAI